MSGRRRTNRCTRAAIAFFSNSVVDTTLTADARPRELNRYPASRLNQMIANQPLRIILLSVGLLLAASPVAAQTFEISDFLDFGYYDAKEIGSRDGVVAVYSDGRYVATEDFYEKTPSGATRRIHVRREKKLEPQELAELMAIARGLFQSGPEYIIHKSKSDPPHISITCRFNRRETRITVINFNAGSAAEKSKVPESVLKLMRWMRPEAYP